MAEQGSFNELSTRPDGAFTKLMEWQLSGGDPVELPKAQHRGPPTEQEEPIDREEEEESEDVEEETLKVKKESVGKADIVAEKSTKQVG